jgi:hypothetical protein
MDACYSSFYDFGATPVKIDSLTLSGTGYDIAGPTGAVTAANLGSGGISEVA